MSSSRVAASLLTGKSAFLIDLDGTLVDSSPVHAQAFREAFAEVAPEHLDGFDYERVKGRSTNDALLSCGVADAAVRARLQLCKQRAYRTLAAAGAVPLFPGGERLLARLRAVGRLILVTNGSAASAQAVLGPLRLARHFDGVITGDEVERGKPHPELFLLALQRFELDSAAVLCVEDAESGVAAARAAGIDVVAVNTQQHFPGVASFATLESFAFWIEEVLP